MNNQNNNINEINIDDVISVVLKRKFFIGISSFILVVITTIYLLMIPNIYQSSATLMINGSNQSASSLLSQYSGLASFAGISIPSDSSANKPDLAIETIKSKNFFDHILEEYNLLPDIFAAKRYDISSKEIIYDPKLYNSESQKWVRKPNFLNNIVPSSLEAYEKYLAMLSVYEDPKTGFIKIFFKHVSPEFSHQMVNIIIRELNNTIRTLETDRAKKSLIYLKKELNETKESSIKSSINVLIEKELTKLMTANVDEDYILQYIDKPFIPEKKTSPKRSTILIISALASTILSIMLVLLKDIFFTKKFKQTSN